jgi:hypothetical protein
VKCDRGVAPSRMPPATLGLGEVSPRLTCYRAATCGSVTQITGLPVLSRGHEKGPAPKCGAQLPCGALCKRSLHKAPQAQRKSERRASGAGPAP